MKLEFNNTIANGVHDIRVKYKYIIHSDTDIYIKMKVKFNDKSKTFEAYLIDKELVKELRTFTSTNKKAKDINEFIQNKDIDQLDNLLSDWLLNQTR